jgi:tetraacyldisaccharide 4'-kinase
VKTPWWWATRNPLALALAPLGLVTAAITARRVKKPGFDAGIPVYCAGNATAGGTGKTILVLDLLTRLPGRPFALTRGYRGRLPGPILVNPSLHTAADIGDEALLLAAAAPTIVAADREAGARLAIARGATAIVMDDGLQNPTLTKTCAILVIDGTYGFGNLLVLPAGPLREPAATAAARCHAALIIGEDTKNIAAMLPANLPILRAALIPHCTKNLTDQRVIAFAGIGRPEKFFASAETLGAHLVAKIPFPDHHVYTEQDAKNLLAQAKSQNALLLTTTKDLVKLPAILAAATTPVTVTLTWQNPAARDAVLQARPGGSAL